MRKNFFMDFETLGTSEDAVILSMGILAVPSWDQLGDYLLPHLRKYGTIIYPDRQEQEDKGRRVDSSTLTWWQKQGDEIFQKTYNQYNKAIPCQKAYDKLNQFLIDNQFNFDEGIMWSRGMFETKLFEHFTTYTLKLVGRSIIPYYNWRDTRTACDLLTGSPDLRHQLSFDGLRKHNPLDDCIMDYQRLRYAFTKHKITGLV